MNPQVVWQVWRSIMRETDLQHALFEEGGANLDRFGFVGDARDAALAYSREADRAKWFVLNYRYRLANSFLNALETGAPLVLRSLLAKGFDLRVLGEEFLNLRGWKDYGPFVNAYCGDALQFLAVHKATEATRGLRQLIGLERTAVELLIGLATRPGPSAANGMFRHTPMARYFQSDVRLSVWMRDKKQLGKTDLPDGTEHFLVYLPNLDSAHRFALLPQRAAELYQALAQPCTREQLPQVLERKGYAPSSTQDDECLNVLAGYRAIDLPEKD